MLQVEEFRRLAAVSRNLAEQEGDEEKRRELIELAHEYEMKARSRELALELKKIEGNAGDQE